VLRKAVGVPWYKRATMLQFYTRSSEQKRKPSFLLLSFIVPCARHLLFYSILLKNLLLECRLCTPNLSWVYVLVYLCTDSCPGYVICDQRQNFFLLSIINVICHIVLLIIIISIITGTFVCSLVRFSHENQ